VFLICEDQKISPHKITVEQCVLRGNPRRSFCGNVAQYNNFTWLMDAEISVIIDLHQIECRILLAGEAPELSSSVSDGEKYCPNATADSKARHAASTNLSPCLIKS